MIYVFTEDYEEILKSITNVSEYKRNHIKIFSSSMKLSSAIEMVDSMQMKKINTHPWTIQSGKPEVREKPKYKPKYSRCI